MVGELQLGESGSALRDRSAWVVPMEVARTQQDRQARAAAAADMRRAELREGAEQQKECRSSRMEGRQRGEESQRMAAAAAQRVERINEEAQEAHRKTEDNTYWCYICSPRNEKRKPMDSFLMR